MCVAALPPLTSGVGGLFAASLGLNLFSGLAERSAKQAAARRAYQAALIGNLDPSNPFCLQELIQENKYQHDPLVGTPIGQFQTP